MKFGTRMHLGGKENLIRSHAKIDVGTISGEYTTSVHMFAFKDENVKFFSLQVHNLSYTTRDHKKTRRMRHSRYLRGLSMKRNCASKFLLDCSCACAVQFLIS